MPMCPCQCVRDGAEYTRFWPFANIKITSWLGIAMDAKERIEMQLAGVSVRLKAGRIRCGLSQQQLADRLGVTQAAYSKMELGLSKLSLISLLMLCDILEVSPIFMMTGEGSL